MRENLRALRLRHHVCPECGTPVGNREAAMNRLNEWLRGGARPPSGAVFRALAENLRSAR